MNTWQNNRQNSIKVLKKSLKTEIILLPTLLVGIIILSPALAKSISIDLDIFLKLAIPITISTFLWHLSALLHKPLELNNKTPFMLFIALISLVFGVILNILLIPRFGYMVVAYVSIFSALVYSSIVGLNFNRYLSN